MFNDSFASPEDVLSKIDANNSDSDSELEGQTIFHDMQLFCHAIGEPQLIEKFVDNKVTLGQLLEFEEQDLINCGISLVGDRKKILSHTAQMHCEKWMPSSLQDLTAKSLLSMPGVYIALNDINKHLEYIGITFRYLRCKVQMKPEILELGKDYLGIEKVLNELEDLLKTSNFMQIQARALDIQLRKHSDDPTLQPPNHIDEKYISRARKSHLSRPQTWVAIFAICCATIKFALPYMKHIS